MKMNLTRVAPLSLPLPVGSQRVLLERFMTDL
jgi:hypothetical protein